tara:strand:+ start:15804 stop:15962 length:159 start_codon:yes stop_codon:yes gene_type:complete
MKKDYLDWEAMKLKPFKKDLFQRNVRVFKKSTVELAKKLAEKQRKELKRKDG